MNIDDLNKDMSRTDLLTVRGGNMEIQNPTRSDSTVASYSPFGKTSQVFNFEIQRPQGPNGKASQVMGNFEMQ